MWVTRASTQVEGAGRRQGAALLQLPMTPLTLGAVRHTTDLHGPEDRLELSRVHGPRRPRHAARVTYGLDRPGRQHA
jgi:hypothetical protein